MLSLVYKRNVLKMKLFRMDFGPIYCGQIAHNPHQVRGNMEFFCVSSHTNAAPMNTLI